MLDEFKLIREMVDDELIATMDDFTSSYLAIRNGNRNIIASVYCIDGAISVEHWEDSTFTRIINTKISLSDHKCFEKMNRLLKKVSLFERNETRRNM